MNNETIKISIIVLAYNVEDYVKPCIESIIGQSYKNLEIILVDDGSTDRSPEICDYYSKKDKRVHVIHKRNGGVTSARKAGVAEATGDYVLTVDGDDWIEQDRVEMLVRDGIMPTHADMIYLSGRAKDFGKESIHESADIPIKLFENEEIENEVIPLLSKESSEAFDMAIKCTLWMWAVRRELFLKNLMLLDDRAPFGEDFLCICFCLLEAKSVMTIRHGGYHYVQRTSSAVYKTVINSHRDLQMKIWYRLMKDQLEQRHASERIRKIYSHLTMFNIMHINYDLLLKKFPDYLFPFPKVNRGARIVVYGAGRFGYNLVQNLDKLKMYSIALWVDQNPERPTVPGYSISPRDAIFSADYDFIVVAIMNADVAREIRRSLLLDGIPEEKIATMDASVISEDTIPDEIKDFKL